MSWSFIRRAMWLAFLGGGVAGVIAWLRGRDVAVGSAPTPEWPPLTTVGGTTTNTRDGDVSTTISTTEATSNVPTRSSTSATPSSATPASATPSSATPSSDGSGSTSTSSIVNALVDAPEARSDTTSGDWVAPLADGTCPASHPVKANDNSGIYHVPGGRFYDRTKAERCYADADAAAADGYRAAKA
jgi:hypothetical protein